MNADRLFEPQDASPKTSTVGTKAGGRREHENEVTSARQPVELRPSTLDSTEGKLVRSNIKTSHPASATAHVFLGWAVRSKATKRKPAPKDIRIMGTVMRRATL